MSILSSVFSPLLSLNPENPLDSYNIYQTIGLIEVDLHISVDEILDVLPIAASLLNLKNPLDSTEMSHIAHIESCLLTLFRSKHKCKMWYVLQDIGESLHDADDELDEQYY